MHDSRVVSRRRVLGIVGGAVALSALSGVATARSQSQPDSYAPLGSVEVDGTKEAVVEGEVAYLATTDGFATVDVADPASPSVLADRRNLLSDRENGPLRQIYDVVVDDENLLVVGPAHGGDDGLAAAVLYDVSAPADPRQRTVFETDYPIHNAVLDGATAYLTGNDGRSNPLVVVDVAAGEERGRWSIVDDDEAWLDVWPGFRTLHDLWVQDGVAALAYWDAGTWLVDVSAPTSPEKIARVRGPAPGAFADRDRVSAMEPPGNDHYVTLDESGTLLGIGMESWDASGGGRGGPSGIDLYDVSTPTDARRVATIAPPSAADESREGTWTTSHNFELANDRLYGSWYQGGVRVFDLSDPSAPGLLRAWEDRDTASFWTARAAAPGEFFVASSTDYRGKTPALFTFPDPPLDERSTRTQTPALRTANASEGNASDAATDGAPTPTRTAIDAPTTTSGDGPGFGLLAGAAGLGVGAWRALRGGADRD